MHDTFSAKEQLKWIFDDLVKAADQSEAFGSESIFSESFFCATESVTSCVLKTKSQETSWP